MTKFNELPGDIQELSEKIIEASNSYLGDITKDEGETFGIRRFNPSRSEDSQRYKDIDRHPESVKYFVPPEPSSNEDLDWLMRIDESNKDDPRGIWAVVDEKGEAVGWVHYYIDENLNLEKKKEFGIPEDALVLEVSYSKLFGEWPNGSRFIKDRENLIDEEKRGVAVSGLRQSTKKLKSMEEIVAKNEEAKPRRIFITAYTVPENIPSEKTLEKCNFNKVGTILYEGVENNAWIFEV